MVTCKGGYISIDAGSSTWPSCTAQTADHGSRRFLVHQNLVAYIIKDIKNILKIADKIERRENSTFLSVVAVVYTFSIVQQQSTFRVVSAAQTYNHGMITLIGLEGKREREMMSLCCLLEGKKNTSSVNCSIGFIFSCNNLFRSLSKTTAAGAVESMQFALMEITTWPLSFKK